MPTVEFNFKDLQELIGKELTLEELEELLTYGKAELDDYDKATGTLKISFGDTNLPYLWSAEGFARLARGVLGKEKGIPKLEVHKSENKIHVALGMSKVRPFIAAFSAKGKKIDEHLLKQLIQLQEKLCDSYGRRRRKIAIGVYPYNKINFPIHYKAVAPTEVSFVPLDFEHGLTPRSILEKHPKGKEYGFVLEGLEKYPLLMDDKEKVLSFPPIINSRELGKVEVGDAHLFVEVTGTDEHAVHLVCAILAYAFSDRGFTLDEVTVQYPTRSITTPVLETEKIKVRLEDAENMIGVHFTEEQANKLLENMRYEYSKGTVTIPPFRQDILHPVDVYEDLAIAYGFDNLPVTPMTSYTVGEVKPSIQLINKVREILVGLGMQEVMSPTLTNKDLLYKNMNLEDFGTVEIKEYISSTYSVVRSWIMPLLLDVLSKNKHHDYPQLLFEQGEVSVRKDDDVTDYERVSMVICDAQADFTKAKQVLAHVLSLLEIEFVCKATEHGSFIPGRVARITAKAKGKSKDVAYVGEINPQVLANFDVTMPVAAIELNLSDLMEIWENK
jgi:phenylalanyl-tRNA synthetase beta chain